MVEVKAAQSSDVGETPEGQLRLHAIRLQSVDLQHWALHTKLSHVQRHNRRPQHMSAAKDALASLVRKDDDRLYELANGDLVAVVGGGTLKDVYDTAKRVRHLFDGDPILELRANGKDRFCTVFDLSMELPAFILFATKRDERSRAEYERRAMKLAGYKPRSNGEVKHLEAAQLLTVAEALEKVELRKLVRQQAICAVIKDSPPHAVLHELYVSISDLQEVIAPGFSLVGNAGLFQYLTQSLDRRMLDLVGGFSARTMSNDITININVTTLLSDEFTFFDRNLQRQDGRALVLEIPIVDIFADTPAFMYARDFARERGYRVLVDGTHHLVAPFINRALLGVDFVKIRWNPQLQGGMNSTQHKVLEDTVRAAGPNRVILCRCDNADAVTFGHSLGISLYQGYGIDAMLKQAEAAADVVSATA